MSILIIPGQQVIKALLRLKGFVLVGMVKTDGELKAWMS